ncbi:MAG: hypothetical protein KF866_09645 [Phycisphaeraceae bacterium]|nr:hypothetical protein [Phycisphaeraceae bacterium]MCW5754762.1 hypothetical protein [Phycisphaeraceae bacterium]
MTSHVAKATVLTEEEIRAGWSYVVSLRRGEKTTRHRVRLAWVDHDHWSGGRFPPSLVIERLIELLAEMEADIPEHFDASTARRWRPGLDDHLTARL